MLITPFINNVTVSYEPTKVAIIEKYLLNIILTCIL